MKNIFFIILLIFLNQCSTSSPEVKIKTCNVKQNFAFEETDPEWFKENDDELFNWKFDLKEDLPFPVCIKNMNKTYKK